jgi:hypothetical protein
MFEADSLDSCELDPAVTAPPRGRSRRSLAPALSQQVREIQPLPRWARVDATARDARHDAQAAAFLAGASLLALDQILRSGETGGEPCYAGVLRQRLALKAAATCARLSRFREDETALRDAEHLGGGNTSPAGRVHRLFRLLATRPMKFDATTLSLAAQHFEALSDLDALGLADALGEVVTSADNPLAAAAHASAAAMHYLAAVPAIDAEIFALWLADLVLAQKLAWKAPVPLLATAILHPALRRDQNGRRPRPGDRDWSNALASAYALAGHEAVDLALILSRQAKRLFDAAPKLRAKGAGRVIDILLADDCVSPARAAKYAKLSDRSARRFFDRLTELGAVRELSGRASFRLYGL